MDPPIGDEQMPVSPSQGNGAAGSAGPVPGQPTLQELIGNLSAAAQALAGAAGGSRTQSYESASRLVKPPDLFAPKTLEEEVSQWPDWSFSFRVYLGFIDPMYAAELRRTETATVPINSSGYSADEAARSVKLYAILASYLRNRPLKLLKSEPDQDGYKVWQRLFQELEPSSRTRGLAMAQALVSFPAMTKGTSILDYLLTYEKLVSEYEKISYLAYDENLKIGTVLKGLPNELRKHILVGLRPDTKYEEIRTRLLEYERSTQSWNAENILQSFSMDSMYKSSSNNSNYQGPQPMEIDRINGKGQDKEKEKEKEKGSSEKEVKDKMLIRLEKVEAEELITKDVGATEKDVEEALSLRKEQEQLGNMATGRVKVKERIRKESRSLKELATTVARQDTKHQRAT